MAIFDIVSYAHLSEEDVAGIGRQFAEIEKQHRDSPGQRNACYIHTLIRIQRTLEVTDRGLLMVLTAGVALNKLGMLPKSWKNTAHWGFKWAGAPALGLAKILENLEVGHNTMYSQWDWMNDPEIRSATWEWDSSCPSSGWKHSHNFVHHKYTNVLGIDNDVGYGILRMTRDRRWKPSTLLQPMSNVVLANLFQWTVTFYDVELGHVFAGGKSWDEARPQLTEVLNKSGCQVPKDYVLFPVMAGPRCREVAFASMMANLVRDLWACAVIFCRHFPDGAEIFTKEQYSTENKSERYLRQMLGSVNFHDGLALSVLPGSLNYQIEHHLFPDMPSNRLTQISKQIRQICREHDLPYNTGPFPKQFSQVQHTLLKLSLPDHFLIADPDNALEVRSKAASKKYPRAEVELQSGSTQRKDLATGLRMLRRLRPGARDIVRAYTGRSTHTTARG